MKKAIRWLDAASKVQKVYEKSAGKMVDWKINMITFTFKNNMQDDDLARLILGKWFDIAKLRFGFSEYVWKAEVQERGAIHFHVISNCYIPHSELRYTWNRLLRKHKLNNIDDNSTDIHALGGVENMVKYLTDYMTQKDKEEGRRKIKGRLWGCSHGLSSAGKECLTVSFEELGSWDEELKRFSWREKIIAKGEQPPDFLDYTRVWLIPKDYYVKLPDCELKTLWVSELKKLQQQPKPDLFPLLHTTA